VKRWLVAAIVLVLGKARRAARRAGRVAEPSPGD